MPVLLGLPGVREGDRVRGGVAVRCGGCVALSDHRKERRVGWCLELRRMVVSDVLRICPAYRVPGG